MFRCGRSDQAFLAARVVGQLMTSTSQSVDNRPLRMPNSERAAAVGYLQETLLFAA